MALLQMWQGKQRCHLERYILLKSVILNSTFKEIFSMCQTPHYMLSSGRWGPKPLQTSGSHGKLATFPVSYNSLLSYNLGSYNIYRGLSWDNHLTTADWAVRNLTRNQVCRSIQISKGNQVFQDRTFPWWGAFCWFVDFWFFLFGWFWF